VPAILVRTCNPAYGEIIEGSGHWLMEEAPQTVIPAIMISSTESLRQTWGRIEDREWVAAHDGAAF
jgi:pimeloyl-ACP methyl ester carboxylesterase